MISDRKCSSMLTVRDPATKGRIKGLEFSHGMTDNINSNVKRASVNNFNVISPYSKKSLGDFILLWCLGKVGNNDPTTRFHTIPHFIAGLLAVYVLDDFRSILRITSSLGTISGRGSFAGMHIY